jgi:hypothetical protein
MVTAAWVTAIATTALAFFGIITAIYAMRAFGKQSEQVNALHKQVTDLAFFRDTAEAAWRVRDGGVDEYSGGQEPPNSWP